MRKALSLTTGILAIVLFFAGMTNISSCTKDTITIEHDSTTTTIIIKDTVTVTSQMSLLTGKLWIFDSVYTNYTGPGTGTLFYTYGQSNPTFDNAAFCYFTNGTEATFNVSGLGNYALVTWSFINADSTEIYYPANPLPYADYQRILQLTPTHAIVYDSTNSALDYLTLHP